MTKAKAGAKSPAVRAAATKVSEAADAALEASTDETKDAALGAARLHGKIVGHERGGDWSRKEQVRIDIETRGYQPEKGSTEVGDMHLYVHANHPLARIVVGSKIVFAYPQ